MEQWQDQGIVLAARRYAENGAIVSILTENYGRRAGFLHGAFSSRNRGTLEIGNVVDVHWQARTEENLGTFKFELKKSAAAPFLADPLKLAALQAACALCDQSLPEREGHPGLYRGFVALLDTFREDIWAAAYIIWEIALLKELGFSLDLTRCAAGGDSRSLAYVSPKTGRAVSYAAGETYKARLLDLPAFLKPNGGPADDTEILTGLRLTGYFLEHWAFTHHSEGIPEARRMLHLRFAERFEKTEHRAPLKDAG